MRGGTSLSASRNVDVFFSKQYIVNLFQRLSEFVGGGIIRRGTFEGTLWEIGRLLE